MSLLEDMRRMVLALVRPTGCVIGDPASSDPSHVDGSGGLDYMYDFRCLVRLASLPSTLSVSPASSQFQLFAVPCLSSLASTTLTHPSLTHLTSPPHIYMPSTATPRTPIPTAHPPHCDSILSAAEAARGGRRILRISGNIPVDAYSTWRPCITGDRPVPSSRPGSSPSVSSRRWSSPPS